MDIQPVISAAIRNAVRKGIRDIRRDPNRSIRMLVELGMQFGTGAQQQRFFTGAYSLLKKQNSPYYVLVSSLIQNVNPHTLETVGINVGYLSWTVGAKTIRAYEKKQGVNVPWTLLVDISKSLKPSLDLSAMVTQGQQLGIHTYFLFVGKDTADLGSILTAAEQHQNCAFFLLSCDDWMNHQLADSDALLSNILIVPHSGKDVPPDVSQRLSQKKRMFGLNCTYNAATINHYLSDAFLSSVVRQGYPFLFFIPAEDCDDATREHMYEKVLSIRNKGRFPLFPIELPIDIQQVDHIISNERCMLTLAADGSVDYPKGFKHISLQQNTLEELIHLTMPRVRRHH